MNEHRTAEHRAAEHRAAEHRAAAMVMADDCLCFRARRVSRALTRMYDEALRPLGIQATQLTVLNAIALCGDAGGAMSMLADVLAMDVTTLSRALRPLEKAGLIRTQRSSSDRRVRVVGLTSEGERLIEDALPLWTQAHERVVDLLGSDAAVQLRDSLDAAVSPPPGLDRQGREARGRDPRTPEPGEPSARPPERAITEHHH